MKQNVDGLIQDVVRSVESDLNGSPITISEKSKLYGDRIALGEIPGVSSLFKFGGNASLGTSESLMRSWNGDDLHAKKLGETFRLAFKSDSADDTALGIGARRIAVVWLDAAGFEFINEFDTNGTTEVDTGLDVNFVQRSYVVKVGEESIINGSKGTINFYDKATPLNIYSQLAIGIGQSEQATYRVPVNKLLLLTGGSAQSGAGKASTFLLKFRLNNPGLAVGEFQPFRVLFRVELGEGAGGAFPTFETPLAVPPNTDIIVTGKVETTTGRATATFGGRLYTIS